MAILNTLEPLVLTTQRTPLIVALSIDQNGQPLQQLVDITSSENKYFPSRDTTPLVLTPVLTAVDPETKESLTPNINVYWFVSVNGGEETLITNTDPTQADTLDQSPTDGFTLDGNELIVTRNVPSTTPVQVRCEGMFTDVSRNETYTVGNQFLLCSENSPEQHYTVDILTPATVKYDPLRDDSSTRVFTAEVRRGDALITSGIRFFWYFDEVLVDPAADDCPLCYVSGQGSAVLTLDADYVDKVAVSVRIADSTTATLPNQPCLAVRTLMWDWPRIDGSVYSANGNAVRQDMEMMTFEAMLKARSVDLPTDKKKYFRIGWRRKATTSSTVTTCGNGWVRELPASDLRQSGNVNSVVYAVADTLGAYHAVASGSNVIVDGNGKIVVERKPIS